jgi:hypothetical protein
MRRFILGAVICLSISPIALADFASDDKELSTLPNTPTLVEPQLSEGALVPPTVELLDIPARYTDGYGTYGGYRYAAIRDHAVIVDPATRLIIAVLP